MSLPSVSVEVKRFGNETTNSPVVFNFSRTGTSSSITNLVEPLTIQYELFGTAKSNVDFAGATSGSLTFEAGSSSTELTLPVFSDSTFDPGETIRLRIVPSSDYLITPGAQFATGTITAEGMWAEPRELSGTIENLSSQEHRHRDAFAALKADGSVEPWGETQAGGYPYYVDADGTGTLSYSWQTSSDGNSWSQVGTNSTYALVATDEGKSIKAVVSYGDLQGFDEVVTTSTSDIPYVDDGDASFSISGTAAVGQTLSVTEDSADPDGTGALSYSWQTSSDGNSWSQVGTNSTYTVAGRDEGKSIKVVVSYTDQQGFSQSISNPYYANIISQNFINIGNDLITNAFNNLDSISWSSSYRTTFGLAYENEVFFLSGSDWTQNYKPVIRKLQFQNENWILNEIQPKLGQLESYTDISTISTINDSDDLLIGGFTMQGRGLANNSDNGYLAKIKSNGDLIWLYDYAPTNSQESLLDLFVNEESIISLFDHRIAGGVTLVSNDIHTGAENWKKENILGSSNSIKDIQINDNEIYILGWEYVAHLNQSISVLSKYSAIDGSLIEQKNFDELFYKIAVDNDGLLATDSYKVVYLNKFNLGEILAQENIDNEEATYASDLVFPRWTNPPLQSSIINERAVIGAQSLNKFTSITTEKTNNTYSIVVEINESSQINNFYFTSNGEMNIKAESLLMVNTNNILELKTGKLEKAIPYVDDGVASFSISGTAAFGQTLGISEDIADADGTGALSYSWQTSTDISSWNVVGTNSTYTIAGADEGKSIKAVVSYTDQQGFAEIVTTSTSNIPYVDNGVASFFISGTTAVGQTLSLSYINDPDGTGDLSYSWQTSSDGNNWNVVGTNSTYTVAATEEGKSIKAVVSYTDQQGFSEVVSTSTSNISYVDNGDASFSISGTAIVGQTLGISEDIADADGTGTLSYQWQSSSDGRLWSNVSTTSSYPLFFDDSSKYVRATISYTDDDGFSESITTDSVGVQKHAIHTSIDQLQTQLNNLTYSSNYDFSSLGYSEEFGSSGSDSLYSSSNEIVWGVGGNDYLENSYSSNDQILMGGSGDDTYRIKRGSTGIIYEAPNHGYDKLYLDSDYSNGYVVSIDNRHVLGIEDIWASSGVIVIDAFSSDIEEIHYGGGAYTTNYFLSQLSSLPGYLGNLSWDSLKPYIGDIYVEELKNEIDHLKSNVIDVESSLETSRNTINNQISALQSQARDLDYSTLDIWSYLASNPDLINAIGTNIDAALAHYINSGRAEGRSLDTFNATQYLVNNPDLASVFGTDLEAARQHYVTSGYAEGRTDKIAALTEAQALSYIASNPDLIAAFGTNTEAAITHYTSNGKAEGRSLDAFNATNYLANYSDLAAAFGSDTAAATRHYITSGYAEGRTDTIAALTEAQALSYIASNPDLINAFGTDTDSAIAHYTSNGQAEGRSLDTFNATNYLANYADLAAAFGSDTEAAIRHYITSGYSEGRTSSTDDSGSTTPDSLTDFETLNYIASHDDLITAFGTNTTAAKDHYNDFGETEGRSLDTFDEWGYLASHNDLLNTFGSDTTAAIEHYISFGMSEGRGTDGFNASSYLSRYGDLSAAFGTNQDLAKRHYVEHGYAEGRTVVA